MPVPYQDRVPTPYQLMMPTLEAMTQLSHQSMEPIHYTEIDSWVVVAFEIQDEVANCITEAGNEPLIKSRLAQARSKLEDDGWIQRSEIPGKKKGRWCLTHKTLREIKNRLRGGGSGTRQLQEPSTLALARRRTQHLASQNQRASIEIINALVSALGNSRKFTIRGLTLPDGTSIGEISVE